MADKGRQGRKVRELFIGLGAVGAVLLWANSGHYESGTFSIALVLAAGLGGLIGAGLWKLTLGRRGADTGD